jgi:hypothetical protein
MNDQHPLSVELLAAATYGPGTEAIHDHMIGCAACRAEFDLLTDDTPDTGPDDAAVRRILDGAPALPSSLINMDRSAGHRDPAPGELWRVGNADEALLALVSSVVGDSAHIVPFTVDLDVADDFSVYVDADASPLGVDAILLYDLARTVPLSAFLTCVGALDVSGGPDAGYEFVAGAAAIAETFAFPIENPHDWRIDPRLEIEELLESLTVPAALPRELVWDYEYTFAALRTDLRERIFGSDLHPLQRLVFPVAQSHLLTCLAKVTHLQKSTVIAALSGSQPHMVFDADTLALTCREVLRLEPDSSAVAVVIPVDTWMTALLTSADTYPALAAPTGSSVGPTTTYFGYGLVDTMHKFLDGRVTAWEDTESAPTRLSVADIDDVVQRHAAAGVQGVRTTGSRARALKKDVWTRLSASTDQAVARFVQALLNDTPVAEALEYLQDPGREDTR